VTADGSAAYVGSANLTGPGLNGASNLELGVLVHGPEVAAIDNLLDLFGATCTARRPTSAGPGTSAR